MSNWTLLLEWLQFSAQIGLKSFVTLLLILIGGLVCWLLGMVGDFLNGKEKLSWSDFGAGIWAFLICLLSGLSTIGFAFQDVWKVATPLGYALLAALPIALLFSLWQSRVFARLQHIWRERCSE